VRPAHPFYSVYGRERLGLKHNWLAYQQILEVLYYSNWYPHCIILHTAHMYSTCVQHCTEYICAKKKSNRVASGCLVDGDLSNAAQCLKLIPASPISILPEKHDIITSTLHNVSLPLYPLHATAVLSNAASYFGGFGLESDNVPFEEYQLHRTKTG